LDVTTIASIATPDMLGTVSEMVQLAIMACDRPPKAIAAEIGCSVDAIYSSMKGIRSIPAKAGPRFAGINPIAAAAEALRVTKFWRLWGYQKVDRHIQSMILRLKARDKEADKMLSELPTLLLDKNSREDLTDEEYQYVLKAVHSMIDRDNASYNLMIELDLRYKLNLSSYLQGKEKSPAA